MRNSKLVRITTVPISLKILLKGQHRFMSQNGLEVVGVASQGKELSEVADEEGIRTVPIHMSREMTPWQDLKSLWQMWAFLRNEKPQIVHTHTPKAGIIGMLAAKLARVPHRLHTVAGLPLMEATGIKRTILDFVEKVTYACATKVYPNSKGLYDFILGNKYTNKGKLKVIANGSSNGIDTLHFSPAQVQEDQKIRLRQELGILPDDFIFVFVGRLVGDKGINELVSAFSELGIPTTKLLLVGGEERELDPLKTETIAEIERNPNIISVGFQKDVRPYLAISHCLTFPSYREGFPNVVMQAGAMGLPSIVSDINGCNEIVIEGENGLIVPAKNQGELKKAMCRIWEDSALYLQLRENSRRLITSRYEQSVVWEALLEEYHSILKAKC